MTDSARESRDWLGIALTVAVFGVVIALVALVSAQFPKPPTETELLCACGGLFAPDEYDIAGALLFVAIMVLGIKYGPRVN